MMVCCSIIPDEFLEKLISMFLELKNTGNKVIISP